MKIRSLPAALRAWAGQETTKPSVAARVAISKAERERDDAWARLNAVIKLCNAEENLSQQYVPIWRIRNAIKAANRDQGQGD